MHVQYYSNLTLAGRTLVWGVACRQHTEGGTVTQKLIRVKIDPAGSLLVAIIDPAGSLLAAKSDPPLQKVIRVQILVDSSLF